MARLAGKLGGASYDERVNRTAYAKGALDVTV